jgi:surface protein
MDNLDFIKPIINDNINYREEQKELISKAIEISNNDKLIALNYIATSMNHEGHNVEFELVFTIPANNEVVITLPIKECNPKDDLGYYVVWDNVLTHNTNFYTFEPNNITRDYHVKFFGLGITKFGSGFDSEFSINDGYRKYLTKVISFGKLGHVFKSLSYAFYKCENNFTIPQRLPSNITDTSGMFYWCEKFNQPLNMWNTYNVLDMENMFYYCKKFNQPLNDWLTHNVRNMTFMFYKCHDFNQPLNTWIVCNTMDMSWMFYRCYDFNQPLSNWNTSNVAYMHSMFSSCCNFNQPLNTWNIHNVIFNNHMFSDCNILEENKPRFK